MSFVTKVLWGLSWACALPSLSAQTIQAVTEDAPPYTYVQHGRVVGPVTEVVEQSLQRAGFKDYRVNLYPWARGCGRSERSAHGAA